MGRFIRIIATCSSAVSFLLQSGAHLFESIDSLIINILLFRMILRLTFSMFTFDIILKCQIILDLFACYRNLTSVCFLE